MTLTAEARNPDDSHFRELFDNAPCGYVVTSHDGVVRRVNATFAKMTGYSPDELVGRTFPSLLTVGSQLFHETRHLPVLRLRGTASEIALSLTCADGTTLPTLMNSVLASSADGGEPGDVRIAVFDSTERRDYEHELLMARRSAESSEAQVRVLQRASTAFTLADTEETLTAALGESVKDAFSATHSSVLLLDSSGVLQLAAGSHPLLELIHAGWVTPATEAIRLRQVVSISSVEEAETTFPHLVPVLHSARLETAIASPLLDKGHPIGAVVCYFGRQRQFDSGLIELLETLTQQSAHVLARIRLQEQLAELALHDQLTGLANRKLLQERLAQTLSGAARSGHPVAIIFLDLDGFKVVNDECGHAVGDSVLEQVADRLRSAVRSSDTIARYGGDEFVVVCDDTDADAAAHIAERIRDAVSQPLDDVPAEFPVSASVGIALLPSESGTVVTTDGILGLADAAMYQSKNAGKDRVTVVHVE